jgi:hypothetical protein
VADPVLGLDHARGARIDLELAPQSQHLNIDVSVKKILMYPGSLQQILPRQRPFRCFEKGQQ